MTATSTAIAQQIKDQCRQLRLPIVAQQALVQSEQVARTGGSGLDLLQVLLDAELQERAKNRARRRIHEARFPLQKTIEGFDPSRNPTVPFGKVRELATCAFVTAHEPVILIGEP